MPTLMLTVTRDAGQLFVQSTVLSRRPVFPYDDHESFYTTCAAQITFLKPPNGPATALILHEDGRDRVAQRVGADVVEGVQRRLEDELRPHAPISIDARPLELYVGRYGNSDATMTIARRGDHLIAQVMGSNKYGVYPYTDRDFFATKFPTQIGFVKDAQRRVVQLVRHQNGEDVAFRPLDQTASASEPGTIQGSR
jgi:D-alanyl-D-alanine carboxypeptidase